MLSRIPVHRRAESTSSVTVNPVGGGTTAVCACARRAATPRAKGSKRQATLLANAHQNKSPRKGQAGMPDRRCHSFSVPNAVPNTHTESDRPSWGSAFPGDRNQELGMVNSSVRPKGCYAEGKRVEARSASRVGARQAGPSARRAGRGWTHVRTVTRNTAIGLDWRVIHATLLANAHQSQAPRTGQAGMPDLRRTRQSA